MVSSLSTRRVSRSELVIILGGHSATYLIQLIWPNMHCFTVRRIGKSKPYLVTTAWYTPVTSRKLWSEMTLFNHNNWGSSHDQRYNIWLVMLWVKTSIFTRKRSGVRGNISCIQNGNLFYRSNAIYRNPVRTANWNWEWQSGSGGPSNQKHWPKHQRRGR